MLETMSEPREPYDYATTYTHCKAFEFSMLDLSPNDDLEESVFPVRLQSTGPSSGGTQTGRSRVRETSALWGKNQTPSSPQKQDLWKNPHSSFTALIQINRQNSLIPLKRQPRISVDSTLDPRSSSQEEQGQPCSLPQAVLARRVGEYPLLQHTLPEQSIKDTGVDSTGFTATVISQKLLLAFLQTQREGTYLFPPHRLR